MKEFKGWVEGDKTYNVTDGDVIVVSETQTVEVVSGVFDSEMNSTVVDEVITEIGDYALEGFELVPIGDDRYDGPIVWGRNLDALGSAMGRFYPNEEFNLIEKIGDTRFSVDFVNPTGRVPLDMYKLTG